MSLVEYVAACQHYGVHVNDEDRDGNMSTMIWNDLKWMTQNKTIAKLNDSTYAFRSWKGLSL